MYHRIACFVFLFSREKAGIKFEEPVYRYLFLITELPALLKQVWIYKRVKPYFTLEYRSIGASPRIVHRIRYTGLVSRVSRDLYGFFEALAVALTGTSTRSRKQSSKTKVSRAAPRMRRGARSSFNNT
jgi:hypothetical protein